MSNTTLSGNYEATNSITVEDNVTVTGTVTLKAGNNIDLKPNFHAANGSNFTSMIVTVANTPKRYYYLKDHLGSIRVIVDEVGNIVRSDDYDPWGMILEGRSTDNNYHNAKYKFTGKERDVETGYLYFGARYYDSRIGRWLAIDPLFKKYPGLSPYAYTLNNPVRFIDLEGKQVWEEVAAGAGALEIAGWATIATGFAISAIGSENTGRGIIEAGEWIQKQSSNLINLIPSLTIAPTPFPVTQGEGINQTTIAPSDVLKIPIVFESGSIPVKLAGGEKGVVQVHINPEVGNVHIQPIGKGQTHHQGVIIDPSKPLGGQIERLVKGPKSAIQKVEQQVQKKLEQLKEIKGE